MPQHRRSRSRGEGQLLLAAAEDYRRHQEARADGSAQTGITIARISAQSSARRQWGDPRSDQDAEKETE